MQSSVWDGGIRSFASSDEVSHRERLLHMFKNCPIPEDEIMANLGIFLGRQKLSRILYMHELYQKIINVHGIVVEFGVRWGQNLALFESFRGIYEPFNYSRKIVGFDTFDGFPSVSEKDGENEVLYPGAFSVTKDYYQFLDLILKYHESESPISHIKKYELVKGDASHSFREYLEKNPHTIIAFAYFDMDIYQPTKTCLDLIKRHVTKGTVIGFDELSYPEFPGETIALQEVFGLDRYTISRSPLSPLSSWIVID